MSAAQAAGDLSGNDLHRQLRRVSLHDDDYDPTQNSDLELHRAELGTQAAARALIPEGDPLRGAAVRTYPFNSAGIVVKDTDVGYALETQNRPVFDNDEGETVDDLTNVHEWAHQWYGNSVTLSDWREYLAQRRRRVRGVALGYAAHGGRVPPPNSSRNTDDHPASDDLWLLPPIPCKNQPICSTRGSTWRPHDAGGLASGGRVA